MSRTNPIARRSERAFTLMELLISIVIIGILIGLLLVGFSKAIRGARAAAGRQDVNSLTIAIQTFKTDFGFLPPLVKDGYSTGIPDDGPPGPLHTIGSGRNTRLAPEVYSPALDDELDFLQDGTQAEDYRFSVYSLSYYLMGALGKEVDYVEGPGSRRPQRDGSFDLLARDIYPPLFDPKAGKVAFAPWDDNEDESSGRIELQDGNGVAYRYYRWEGGTRRDPTDNDLLFPNTPELVKVAKSQTELGSAGYAIVAAGGNRLFGDIPIETMQEIEDKLGKRFKSDADAEDAARADNIVEVGR